MGRRPLEDHVLEKVGHARLAVSFVPRPDQHSQVDRHLGAGRIGEQEHSQAVFQAVLRDSFNRSDLSWCGLTACTLEAPGAASATNERERSYGIVDSSGFLTVEVSKEGLSRLHSRPGMACRLGLWGRRLGAGLGLRVVFGTPFFDGSPLGWSVFGRHNFDRHTSFWPLMCRHRHCPAWLEP